MLRDLRALPIHLHAAGLYDIRVKKVGHADHAPASRQEGIERVMDQGGLQLGQHAGQEVTPLSRQQRQAPSHPRAGQDPRYLLELLHQSTLHAVQWSHGQRG